MGNGASLCLFSLVLGTDPRIVSTPNHLSLQISLPLILRKCFVLYSIISGIGSEKIMSKTITTPYDVAEHLRTPAEMAAYLEVSIEEAHGDALFIAKALGDIARAKGMSQVARDTGLSRESLFV
jgi:probable addiction module antidote protein